MEKLTFREIQRRVKSLNLGPTTGSGVTREVLENRLREYEERNKESNDTMKEPSNKRQRKKREEEFDLYSYLLRYIDRVPDLRPMETVSLMRDKYIEQNTQGLIEDELNALFALEDEGTEEERLFVERLVNKSEEFYRYVDQFSFVVDRFIEKYPITFITLLYAFEGLMDEIILSSTDKRIKILPILDEMIRSRLNHVLMPWLLRSFFYMEEMDVLSYGIKSRDDLNKNPQEAISILVGSTRSRLSFIVAKKLPYQYFENTMTTFLYVSDFGRPIIPLIPIIIDNIHYLQMWLDIADLFVIYTDANYIWGYFGHLLRIVIYSYIKTKNEILLIHLLNDALFQYNMVPYPDYLPPVIVEINKHYMLSRIISRNSHNKADHTMEPVAYIFSTFNKDAMNKYWSIVSESNIFMEYLQSPNEVNLQSSNTEKVFWYVASHFIKHHGRSFPSLLLSIIHWIKEEEKYYMPHIVWLLGDIACQESILVGKRWKRVFDSLLLIVSNEAIEILLVMTNRVSETELNEEELRLVNSRHAWLTKPIKPLKKRQYYIDSIREEARRRNISAGEHITFLNVERIRI